MNRFIKIISCILISILFISSLPLIASAESTIISRDEALNWLYSVEGTSVGTPYGDGYYGECASLGYRYYEKLLGRGIFIDGDPNRTGNGNDYDDDNHSINLGWSRFAITSSTVLEAGDVIVSNYEPNGHVAIFISGTATNATLMEQSNSYLSGITQKTYNKNLVGRTCVRPVWKSSVAPNNAILSINKENFLLGETFTLTCEADSYCEYYMSIIDVDSGQVVDSGGISGTYSNSFQRAGHYTAYVTAYNSQGSINSNWVDFYFFGAPPTVANLSVNKSKLCLGESIEFNTYTNAYYSKIYMTIMAEKGDVVYSGNIPYQFEYIPSEGGVYYTHITAYTHEGGVDSNHISFEVYDSAAINPKITSNKTVISTGENIIFNFEADFATNYVLGIDKKGYGRISTPNVGTDSSYTTSFLETGIYSVYATCYNELGGCDSSKIEFIVIDEKSTFCIQNSDSVRIIKKINGNSNNYSCIIALYQNRKLVKYLNKPNLNGTTILDETILCSDEYDEIKVMVWNGLSTLKPLCDAEVIPHTEFITE